MESIDLDLVTCHGAYGQALDDLTEACEALAACGFSVVLWERVKKLRIIFTLRAREYQECLKKHGKHVILTGL